VSVWSHGLSCLTCGEKGPPVCFGADYVPRFWTSILIAYGSAGIKILRLEANLGMVRGQGSVKLVDKQTFGAI